MKAKIGRPRSEKSQGAILDAVDALLKEKGGAGLSIEAIASRAKVGKKTIYRWWPSIADIVLEAGLRRAAKSIPVPAEKSFEETFRIFLSRSMLSIADGGDVYLRYLMAYAQQDELFRARFREQFVEKRRAVLSSILLQATESGQIKFKHETGLLVDIVFGAMWYRLLVGHSPLDEAFADELTAVVMGYCEEK
ncbi:TetR/AcrR family transcriptional regulator [Pseudodesulfovibrio sp. zrk46]|uniref:TetR/AcrR family transcriptional regulator n=1 Tax=Pseudodesulfovibrio sp. zrk46 TaxID=2725288 RepID=UPI001FFD7E49|nr:TetR/AcrR family transcriptional regulator [Pseudodesulfovibrio sp. zrk46]